MSWYAFLKIEQLTSHWKWQNLFFCNAFKVVFARFCSLIYTNHISLTVTCCLRIENELCITFFVVGNNSEQLVDFFKSGDCFDQNFRNWNACNSHNMKRVSSLRHHVASWAKFKLEPNPWQLDWKPFNWN